MNNDRNSWIRKVGLLSVILVDVVGYTLAGIGLGYFLWAKWHWPWWTMVLTSLSGLVLAMIQLYKIAKREL